MLLWIPALCLAALSARGQEPLVPPTPFLKTTGTPPGNGLMLQISAQRALEMGFPSIATDLYQRLLGNPATPVAVRNGLIVDLATALLDEDRTQEAEAALQKFVGLPTAAYRLRLGLVHARSRRYDQARGELAAIGFDELPAGDRSWYYFLDAMLADVARDFNRSRSRYQQAIDAAVSEAQRARFTLAREQARLSLGDFSEPLAAALRQNVERFQGRALYDAVSSYAVVLNGLGRKPEALTLLQRQLQALPFEERATNDEWRLLVGIIGDAEGGPGRTALSQLLAHGTDPGKQRIALQLLARGSQTGVNRTGFRQQLDELLGATPAHPLTEDLLLFRAQLALGDKDYARAETDANQLLERFPGTQFKAAALGVLTGVAWEQSRYRNAASLAARVREELKGGETRAQLGVLVAEAYFRAGAKDEDRNAFRNAADAYGATVDEVPAGVEPGGLIFQRILSQIDAGAPEDLEKAQGILDQYARDARLDPVNRWQAEWNLSRALEVAGETTKAYTRINRLMETTGSTDGLPAELRARLRWLQAHLSLQAGEPARTLTLAEALLNSLDGVGETLRPELASTALLLQARANFVLTRTDAAMERFNKLRADHPQTDAAVYSFMVQADDAARKGQLVEAQGLLIKLADEFPRSVYAPYALYQAALYAERRGQETYYADAYKILENRLVKDYPQSDLIFYARLKQGNLLRLLNDYGRAQLTYELLVNQYSQHQDVYAAQLALADCHAALADADASHQESAATIYERLLDLQTVPPDVRVEAGFKYGLNQTRRGNLSRALEIWGRLMTVFLPDDAKSAALGAKGRYWMSRALLQLGGLLEQQAKLEQAREAYTLIVSKGLPGATLAQERLARLRPPSATAATP